MKQQGRFGLFQRLTAALALLVLAGCAGIPGEPSVDGKVGIQSKRLDVVQRSGFACCNLHYSGELISDANYAQLPFIPAGTPVKIMNTDGARVRIDVNGKSMQFGVENGRESGTIEQWLNRIVVAEDPRLKMAAFLPAVREAIKAGKLMRGMTREQVIMAVGHPQTNDNLRLGSAYWRYWWSSYDSYYVYWSKNATLSKIDGQAETVNSMTYKGK